MKAKITNAEMHVMRVIWEKAPVTVNEVVEILLFDEKRSFIGISVVLVDNPRVLTYTSNKFTL